MYGIDELQSELAQTKKALALACETLADTLQQLCPADIITFAGDCTNCSNKNEADCWTEHLLREASEAGEPNAR